MINHYAIKDDKKRALYAQHEIEKRQYKAIMYNMSFPIDIRFQASLALSDMSRHASITRLRNRCIITGRSRGVYRRYRISRIKIRDLITQNKIPGLRKSSW